MKYAIRPDLAQHFFYGAMAGDLVCLFAGPVHVVLAALLLGGAKELYGWWQGTNPANPPHEVSVVDQLMTGAGGLAVALPMLARGVW